MHIALNGWFWNRPNSGSGQYIRYLTYHLNRLVSDLDLTLICPASEKEPDAVPPSVHVKMVANRPGQVGKVLFEQYLFPKAVAEVGADLAHVPYWGPPMQCAAPVVVTIHDITTELVREYRDSVKARIYNALITASARGASHIITDSNSARDDIIRHLKIEPDNVSTVYLGVDTNVFTPEDNFLLDMAVQKQYDLPDDYILYLGGYEIHKNVVTLLHAYTYVSRALGEDYPLLLAGRQPE
ncbi:MAG: glycosyltransferase, partial [Candidatus Promineifilaceae bacterium]